MVKKIIALLILVCLSIFSFSRLIVLSNYDLNIDNKIFEDDNLIVLNIYLIRKEDIHSRITDFVKDDSGNYIYYSGSYYYTGSKTRYKYDYETERFVPDKYGIYVYATQFYWARNEKEKYIISDFYRKIQEEETQTLYYIFGYLMEIDQENFLLKSFTPFTIKTENLADLESKIISLRKTTNQFNKDKIDIIVNFNEKTPLQLRAYILSKLQEDTRYNIYDRNYIEHIFEEYRLKDFLGKDVKIKYNPPKYIIDIKTTVNFNDVITKDLIRFFNNTMNGSYLSSGEKVQVGNYYSFDNGNYYLDKKDGKYVKILNFPWRKERYTYATNFYDLIYFPRVKYYNYYISLLTNIIETETGKIINSKKIDKTLFIPEIEILDRFKSYTETNKTEMLNQLYVNISSDLQNELKRVFPLSSFVKEVKDLSVTLYDGKNIGIKSGQKFRILYDHWTQGYLKIENSFDYSSNGEIFYLLPNEIVKPYALVLESFNYPQRYGVGILIGYSYPNNFFFNFKFRFLNIHGNENLSVGIGFKSNMENSENESYTSPFYTLELSKKIGIIDLILRVYFKETIEFTPGFRLNTVEKNSLFSNEGFGFFIDTSLDEVILGAEWDF